MMMLPVEIDNPAFAESQAFGNDYDDYFAEAGRYLIEKGKGSGKHTSESVPHRL